MRIEHDHNQDGYRYEINEAHYDATKIRKIESLSLRLLAVNTFCVRRPSGVSRPILVG